MKMCLVRFGEFRVKQKRKFENNNNKNNSNKREEFMQSFSGVWKLRSWIGKNTSSM